MSSVYVTGFRFVGRKTIQSLINPKQAGFVIQKLNISSKAVRSLNRIPKPKPWPYNEKIYTIWQSMIDKTTKRLDDNSKVICVEGPVAVGKTKFAKELADELEMLYVPEGNLDLFYINPYGYDMRQLDPQLPESCKSYDQTNFCKNPKHKLSAQFQIRTYMSRYHNYIDALAHVFNTGQGVVLDRSPFSDYVFVEAMFKSGYISAGARSVYFEIRHNTIGELLKPHLVVYLDAPVSTVQERIKSRNLAHEVNGSALTDKYLADMEVQYKQHFLKDISIHAELLVYDWSEGGDTEIVVEDIERIDFDQFEVDKHNKKMKDWRLPNESHWCAKRIKYTHEKDAFMNFFNVPRLDVPELIRSAEDGKILRDVWCSAPGMKYVRGYNEDMGDTGLLTKIKMGYRNSK